MQFDFFDVPEEVEVDTRYLPKPLWLPPSKEVLTPDDFLDLDDMAIEIEQIASNYQEGQAQKHHEKSTIRLRKYQQEASDAVFREWLKDNWSTLVVMATATGKTFVIADICRRYQGFFGLRPDGFNRRGLILAHRDYLLAQISNALAAMGIDSAIEKAEKKARGGLFDEPQVVVASVQSMQNNRKQKTCEVTGNVKTTGTARLLEWPRDYFDFIITDEGHHGPSKTYTDIYKYFRPYCQHRAFLTATPKRMDDETLEDLCHSRAFVFDIVEAAQFKPPCICTNIKVRYCDTKIDISNIRTTGLDLNPDDIAEAIKPYIEPIARAIKKEVEDRTFVGFWPDVGCSQAINSALVSLGINCAHLDAKSRDQEQVLSGFRAGLYQGLNNCAKFGEGFDLPDVSAIILGKPTQSEGLYRQMVGRGLRLKMKGGRYQDLILIDFPWVAGKHSLVRPADIFRSSMADDEVFTHIAAMLETENGTDDLMSAITRGEREVKEQRQIKVKATDGRVKYTRMEFDPLGLDLPPDDEDYRQEREFMQPLSDKQIAILERNGIDGIEMMSRKKASFLISKIFERRDKGLATFKQIKVMIKRGVNPKLARSVSFQEASAILDRLIRK